MVEIVLADVDDTPEQQGWVLCRSPRGLRIAMGLYDVEAAWFPAEMQDDVMGALVLYCVLTKSRMLFTRQKLSGVQDTDFVKVSFSI
jgi:hypothetical protein